MAQISNEIASEYDRIYARATADPGSAGDEGEENWATLLREWLPTAYHVETKGRLISHDGRTSPQVDVIVLKPSYPPKLLERRIWLAGGVAAVFECKTTLTAKHVRDSVMRCKTFKELYAVRRGSPRLELTSPLIYGLLAHSHSWKGKKSDPIANVEDALAAASQELDHPRLEMDMVCVANLATWHKSYIARYDAAFRPEQESAYRELFGASCGPMTSLIGAHSGSHSQKETFRPLGAFVSHLTQRLAWDDPPLRDVADYYRLVNLWGSGSGKMRAWPISVYSDDTRSRVEKGPLSNGVSWDDWSFTGL